MKILQVANFVTPTSGGLRTTVEALAQEYRGAGHRSLVVTPAFAESPWRLETTAYVGIGASRVPFTDGYRAIVSRKALVELVSLWRPDVIELHDRTTLSWVPRWSAEHGIPCVLVAHERVTDVVGGTVSATRPLIPLLNRWSRRATESASAIVCASRFAAEDFATWSSVVNIVTLGVDANFTESRAVARDSRTVIFVGRLSPEKNPELLLKACHMLAERGRSLRVVFVGDGPLREELERRAVGIDAVFVGYVRDRSRVAEELSRAAVCVAPSTYETFGLSIVEALACGTPVVVPSVGAGQEIVTDRCGAVADPTPECFADAIERVLARSSASTADECRSRARHFSWSTTARRLTTLYSSLLDLREEVAA